MLGELMKTNDCHYQHFASHHTGSITKPDMAFSSWPQQHRVKSLHLCFYFLFFLKWDCDSVTRSSAVPHGIICQIWQSIAQWFQDYRGGEIFPKGSIKVKKRKVFHNKRCFRINPFIRYYQIYACYYLQQQWLYGCETNYLSIQRQ